MEALATAFLMNALMVMPALLASITEILLDTYFESFLHNFVRFLVKYC